PTDKKYDAYVGLMGKLTHSFRYSVSGHYVNEANKAMYQANPSLDYALKDYEYGNSFFMVYDDIKTLSFAGELNVDLSRNFKLGAKAEFFSYNSRYQNEAWNLPDVKASLFLDYQIDENWFAGAGLFYVGERKDQPSQFNGFTFRNYETITLDGYFDANAHVGYRLNDQLSFYLKANNIGNQRYERWLNTPVQGVQILAGATYQ